MCRVPSLICRVGSKGPGSWWAEHCLVWPLQSGRFMRAAQTKCLVLDVLHVLTGDTTSEGRYGLLFQRGGQRLCLRPTPPPTSPSLRTPTSVK